MDLEYGINCIVLSLDSNWKKSTTKDKIKFYYTQSRI